MRDAVRHGDLRPEHRVADLVAVQRERQHHDGALGHPVAGGEHTAHQRLRRETVRTGPGDWNQDDQVGREGPGRSGDLGELRPVQRPVGDHTEHPARRQAGPDFGRGGAQAPERAGPAVADLAHRTGDTHHAPAGGPGFRGVERRDRSALGVGEHDDPLQRVRSVDLRGEVVGHLQGDRHRPVGLVRQPATARKACQVGATQETGQRGVCAGEQQLKVGKLMRAWRVARRLPEHGVGKDPSVRHADSLPGAVRRFESTCPTLLTNLRACPLRGGQSGDAGPGRSAGVAHTGGDAVDRGEQRTFQSGHPRGAGRPVGGGLLGERSPGTSPGTAAAAPPGGGAAAPGRCRARRGCAAQHRLGAPAAADSPVIASTSVLGQLVLLLDLVEDRVQLLRAPASRRSARAMLRSVLASIISTLDRNVRKKCQPRVHLGQPSASPAARAAASPEPTPNQPGTICRVWVQPNTHGMARRPPSPAPVLGRFAGREPMFSAPSSSVGVDAQKYAGRSGSSTSDR